MKVGVIGASGLVGKAICELLQERGHQWIGFSRSPEGREGVWRGLEEGFEGVDAVVNMAGDSVDKRWTDENKKKFHQSRVGVTNDLVAKLGAMSADERPKILVNASAVGFYGDQGDAVLNEGCPLGGGYLASLCEEWEAAAVKAEHLGVRVVRGRIGVVLGSGADSWKRMRLIFSLGGGGPLGGGQQFWPIVHVDDVAGGVVHALENDSVNGALNLVGEEPVRNVEFTKALGRALRRPAILPAPAFALKLVFGGFAEALLASYRVVPDELKRTGYEFRHPKLEKLLESLG